MKWNKAHNQVFIHIWNRKGITQNECHFLRTAAWRLWNCKTHHFCESIGWIVQSLDHSDSQLAVSSNKQQISFGFVYSINQLDPTSLISHFNISHLSDRKGFPLSSPLFLYMVFIGICSSDVSFSTVVTVVFCFFI